MRNVNSQACNSNTRVTDEFVHGNELGHLEEVEAPIGEELGSD